ncbi:hypothetical protein [Stenotrophomonas phage StenM_174]|nr:hypothetical protein [Stenotrophomonas phage StenM_174]
MARPIRLNAHPMEMSLEALMGRQVVGLLDVAGGHAVKLRIQRVHDAVMIDEVEVQASAQQQSQVPVYSVHKKDPPPAYPHWNAGWDVRRLDPNKKTPVDDRGGVRVANFRNEEDAIKFAGEKNAQAHTEVPTPRFTVERYSSGWGVADAERIDSTKDHRILARFGYNDRAAADEYAKSLNDKVK